MVLTITNNTDKDLDKFVKVYLINYIYTKIIISLDLKRLKVFDDYLNINSRFIILLALRNLIITKQSEKTYNISFNKNIKYKGQLVYPLIKFITYGNRELKGYPIILDWFKLVERNISSIYKEYRLKYGD